MNESSHCEFCQEQMHCRNLYVAIKILEEELQWAHRIDLTLEFQNLIKQLKDLGYSYPSSGMFCSISGHAGEARRLVQRADTLLKELRQTIKLHAL